jgi:predicted alpha/beta hydrolase family esterase
MSPPTPSPRFCRKNWVAKARDRVSADEKSTIIVASAGCITA